MHFLETMKAMLVWTGAGAVLLFVLMYIDSLFTKYKDFAEVKAGNMVRNSPVNYEAVCTGVYFVKLHCYS